MHCNDWKGQYKRWNRNYNNIPAVSVCAVTQRPRQCILRLHMNQGYQWNLYLLEILKSQLPRSQNALEIVASLVHYLCLQELARLWHSGHLWRTKPPPSPRQRFALLLSLQVCHIYINPLSDQTYTLVNGLGFLHCSNSYAPRVWKLPLYYSADSCNKP